MTHGLPVSEGRQTWREVWRTSRGHRLRLLLVVVLGIASAAAGLVAPAAIGYLVDRVHDGTGDLSTLLRVVAAMIAAAIAGAAGSALTTVLAARTYHAILARLRERLVERAMALPQHTIERAGTGDLVSRTSDDVAQIADAAPSIIPAFTTTGFTIAVTLAGMTALDPWFGLALIAVLPVYGVTMRWYLRTAPRIYQAERAAMSDRAQQLLESQRGYDTVVGFGLGRRRHERVLEASWQVVRYSLRARTVQNMFFGRLNLAEYLGMAAILLAGFWLIDAGLSTVGAATTAMLLFLRLFGPINHLLFVVDVLQSVAASLNRMIGVILAPVAEGSPAMGGPDADENERDATARRDASGERAAVRLRGAVFGYDEGRRALDGVDLTIEPGRRVAVVGASGAGKTTLAAVIAGIHPPDAGTVERPERTAVISQEVHVFAGTLRENLTLAAPGAEDSEIEAALEATGSSGLLALLPAGLDTRLGSGGRELTAAQAQQIALARVVLADPELAILDEATAESGSAEAGLLDRAADAALAGRTGIVIAHRLSQAAACDRVLVMAEGRIIEDGAHDELVASGGVYARLWEAWAATAEPAGPGR
ncbi:ABC transporter ATP-binding protein [Gulosibacter sp. 10]|uniref:ABC transporter ATP-binding protein n=1 Tax=Gulosibacter sp. 10 TaxID=1255570 RepID=UPI00097EF1D2|nr:ABC transporter ATP-binding protein [Gulosibacter sp. 10]SJM70744.1 ABC transporter, transmembrane region:ABC transporter [Gulosibacter sp. 10]